LSHPPNLPPVREPRLASVASWAVLVASFGLSASTWIALGVLAGFTGQWHIGQLTLHLAWLMPVAVDGYLVVALVLWMSPVPAKVARFARTHTYFAAVVGIVAQSSYHTLQTWSDDRVLWRAVMACGVGSLPPAVAAFSVHLRALIRRESKLTPAPAPVPPEPPAPRYVSAVLPVPAQRPMPVMDVMPVAEQPEPEPAKPAELVPVAEAPRQSAPDPALLRTKVQTTGYPLYVPPRDLPAPAPAVRADSEPPEQEPEVPWKRRSKEETRRLALDIIAREPDIKQEDLAARLNCSTRYLRGVLNDPATLAS